MQKLQEIRSQHVQTELINSHVLSCGAQESEAIVLLHGNLSSATFFEELMLSLSGDYHCIAPDLRGYGDTQDLPIEATRGARDWADDLRALLDKLGIESAHLLGWSAGAAGIMQFALDHPGRVNSLILVAPVSPYGFGGTCDVKGSPSHLDFAGSGAGIVNAELVELLQTANTEDDSSVAPLNLLREYFVKPPFRMQREAILVEVMSQLKFGERRYPGDFVYSPNWPHVAPGQWGPMNALSPKYFDVSGIVELEKKPDILWLRGDSDQIVADKSMFDTAALVSTDEETAIRAQPMVGQMDHVLRRYQATGGQVQRVELHNTGHSPFLEKPEEFSRVMSVFLAELA